MSGLPRSGSTLLMNILAQNPNIQPSGTSGLIEVIQGMRNQYTNSINVKAQDDAEMNRRFTNAAIGAIRGWGHSSEAEIYVDKSRGWPQHYEFLQTIGFQPLMIVTVRDLRAVLSSMEKLYRKNSLRVDPTIWADARRAQSTEGRVQLWAGGAPVGDAASQIQDLIHRGHAENVLFVRYEDLISNPSGIMLQVYDYIDEEPYDHDFENIEQVTQEDDRLHGIPDLHNIRPQIAPVAEDWDEILGSTLANGIVSGTPWFYNNFYNNQANQEVVQTKQPLDINPLDEDDFDVSMPYK